MSYLSRRLLVLLPLLISGCGWLPVRDKGPLPPPNPPVFCYDTLGRAACYDQPQNGLGDLINVQLPPVVVVAPTPVIVTPATAVLTPAEVQAIPDNTTAIVTAPEEPPLLIKNPDPYPEPGDKAEPFTDAPVPLKAPTHY